MVYTGYILTIHPRSCLTCEGNRSYELDYVPQRRLHFEDKFLTIYTGTKAII